MSLAYLPSEQRKNVFAHPNSKRCYTQYNLGTFQGNQLDGIFPSYNVPRKNSFLAYYIYLQSNRKYKQGILSLGVLE